MLSDSEIEEFLDKISKYEEAKQAAETQWKEGFLNLSKSNTLCSSMHDPQKPASLTVDTFELVQHSENQYFGGIWPPSHIKLARNHFINAIKHELRAQQLKPEL